MDPTYVVCVMQEVEDGRQHLVLIQYKLLEDENKTLRYLLKKTGESLGAGHGLSRIRKFESLDGTID